MVFNATFNNISAISWSFIGGGNPRSLRKPSICRKSLSDFITCCIEYTSPWTGFKLTTLVVIGTDCTCSCKSNYNTIMTTTVPSVTSVIYLNHYLSNFKLVADIHDSSDIILLYIWDRGYFHVSSRLPPSFMWDFVLSKLLFISVLIYI